MPLNGTGVMALETGLLAAYGAATINGQMGSNSSFTYTSALFVYFPHNAKANSNSEHTIL